MTPELEAILLSREEAFNHGVYALIRLTKHSDKVHDHLLTSPRHAGAPNPSLCQTVKPRYG